MFNSKANSHLLSVFRIIWLFLFIIQLSATTAEDCLSPNKKPGICRSLYDCPILLNVIESKNSTPSQRDYVEDSLCKDGPGRFPYVCCTENQDIEIYRPPSASGKGAVLPKAPNCGQLSEADRIYGGNETAVDQYPWMVLIISCGTPVCGGSLINQRYVLTAAHCIKPNFMVRLGEYDYSKEIDCIGSFCNQKVLDIKVEEVVIHSQYKEKPLGHFDIALIRLAEDVEYSDFISPVCLPIAEKNERITNGEILTVSGWGRTPIGAYPGVASKVKRHVKLPYRELKECQRIYQLLKYTILDSSICAGGHAVDASACYGDSGGPLMRIGDKGRWHLEGIVSWGAKCGAKNWPNIFTSVRSFSDWIQQNMRP